MWNLVIIRESGKRNLYSGTWEHLNDIRSRENDKSELAERLHQVRDNAIDFVLFKYSIADVDYAIMDCKAQPILKGKVKELLEYKVDKNAFENVLDAYTGDNDEIIGELYCNNDMVCREIMAAYKVAIKSLEVQLGYYGYTSLKKYAVAVGLSINDARKLLSESYETDLAHNRA